MAPTDMISFDSGPDPDANPMLESQLRGAVGPPGMPDVEQLWSRGRRARRRQQGGMILGCLALVAALGFGANRLVVSEEVQPITVDQTIGEEQGLGPRDQGPRFGIDHWYSAFGISVCGEFREPLMSALDETGIHSHQNNIIHIHPWAKAYEGENATLGLFFESMQIDVTDDAITFSNGDVLSTDSDVVQEACGTDDVSFDLVRWGTVTPDSIPEVISTDFGDARLLNNLEAFVLTFSPVDDRSDVLPPSVDTMWTLAQQPPEAQSPWEDFDQFRQDLLQSVSNEPGPIVSTPDEFRPADLIDFPLTADALAEAKDAGVPIGLFIERGETFGWLSANQISEFIEGIGVVMDATGRFDVCCDPVPPEITPPDYTDADVARWVDEVTAALQEQ